MKRPSTSTRNSYIEEQSHNTSSSSSNPEGWDFALPLPLETGFLAARALLGGRPRRGVGAAREDEGACAFDFFIVDSLLAVALLFLATTGEFSGLSCSLVAWILGMLSNADPLAFFGGLPLPRFTGDD